MNKPQVFVQKNEKLYSVEFLADVLRDMFSRLAAQVKIEIIPDGDDRMVEVDGWLWAYATKIPEEMETLRGTVMRMREGFTIGVTKYTPATRWEPDDYEPVEVAQERGPFNTAKKMAALYYDNLVECALEGIEITQYLKEEEM